MTLVLQILGWLLLGWLAFYFALMVVAFWMGFLEAAKKSKRRKQRWGKKTEVGPRLKVVWPD